VRTELIALDPQGDLLPGVASDTLRVEEDGKPQQIDEVKPADEPQSVCILIDSSGSMYERLDSVRHAALRLLDNLPPQDEVCVADFSYRLYIDQTLTADRQLAKSALSHVKAVGGTALRNTLIDISDYLNRAAQNRDRAVILLSDSIDNASDIDDHEMRYQIELRGGMELHIICVPPDLGRRLEPRFHNNQKSALHLTSTFGGLSYFPRNEADLDESVDHLVSAMQSRYVLTYNTANTVRDGKQRQVGIQFDKAHQKARAVIRAQEAYYAPAL